MPFKKYFFLILLFSGCLKAPVELILENIDSKTEVTPLPIAGVVVFVQNNDIYMFDSMTYVKPKRITNTPTITKGQLNLSYDRSKILYKEDLDGTQTPVVIDTNGTEIARYTSQNGAPSFNWAGNNNTIIFNRRLSVYQQGTPVLNQNPPTFGVFQGAYYNFFITSKNNDIFYSVWTSFGDYNYMDYYNTTKTSLQDKASGGRYTNKVQFSPDGSRLVVYEPESPLGNGIQKINIYDVNNSLNYVTGYFLSFSISDGCIGPDNVTLLYTYSEPLSSKYYFELHNTFTSDEEKRFYFTDQPITSIDWK